VLTCILIELKRFHTETCESADSRQYEITRAYTFDSTGSDVLLLGQLRGVVKGRTFVYEVIYRILFENPTTETPKISMLWTWTVGLNPLFFFSCFLFIAFDSLHFTILVYI